MVLRGCVGKLCGVGGRGGWELRGWVELIGVCYDREKIC